MTEEQIEQLLNELSTAAAKFTIVFNGAKEQGGNLTYGLDDVLRPILREALLKEGDYYSNLDSQLRHIFVTEGLIPAIKLYRSETGMFLKESKAYVEDLCKDLISYQSEAWYQIKARGGD
jgi:hypothetical protein